MIISLEPAFVFVHVPKTGGRSISRALQRFVPDTGDIRPDIFDPFKKQALEANPDHQGLFGPAHFAAAHLRDNVTGREFWQKALTFAIVRNPWDRLVSFFSWLQHSNTRETRQYFKDHYTFHDYLRWLNDHQDPWLNENYGYAWQPGRQSQVSYVTDETGIIVDFIGRFESLQEEFNFLCNKLGIPCVILTRAHQTRALAQHQQYAKWFTLKDRELISPMIKEDTTFFKYEFGG